MPREVLPQLGVEAVVESLNNLGLPIHEYIILGGANMVLRGIKSTTEDVDLLVSTNSFDELARRKDTILKAPPLPAQLMGATNQTAWIKTERNPLPISATDSLGDGYFPMTFDEFFSRTELVSGLPCIKLDDLITAKEALQRPKDMADLRHIARFTGRAMQLPRPTVEFPYRDS